MIYKGTRRILSQLDNKILIKYENQLLDTIKKIKIQINDNNEKIYDCAVCMDNPKNTAIVPCGHQFCAQCAQRLHRCPMCRGRIQHRLRLR